MAVVLSTIRGGNMVFLPQSLGSYTGYNFIIEGKLHDLDLHDSCLPENLGINQSWPIRAQFAWKHFVSRNNVCVWDSNGLMRMWNAPKLLLQTITPPPNNSCACPKFVHGQSCAGNIWSQICQFLRCTWWKCRYFFIFVLYHGL